MKKENKSLSLIYREELKLPIFVKFEDASFAENYLDILKELGFEKIDQKSIDKRDDVASSRWLTVKKAGPRVAARLNVVNSINGIRSKESIMPKINREVYRFQKTAMIMCHAKERMWEMGLMASAKNNLTNLRVVFNRYLSFALADYEIIGFWGVPIDDGVVVMNFEESSGEAFFIDMNNQQIISIDGVQELEFGTNFLRLDEGLINRSIKMTKEDLFSFMSLKHTYFSYRGSHPSFSRVIKNIIELMDGLIYPAKNFRPRTVLNHSDT